MTQKEDVFFWVMLAVVAVFVLVMFVLVGLSLAWSTIK